MEEAGIVGGDVVEEARLAEGADDGLAGSLMDADDASEGAGGARGLGLRAAAPGGGGGGGGLVVESDDDLVVVHGDSGVFGVDFDGWLGLAVGVGRRDDHGRSFLAELDGASDEIDVLGDAEAVFLDADDVAFGEEEAQVVVELAAVVLVEL